MRKNAFLDTQKFVENFHRGDLVQRVNYRTGFPYAPVGQVTAVLRGIGFVDVEWPFGNERVQVDELVRINPGESEYLPPFVDTSYGSYDIAKSREEDKTSKHYNYANPRMAAKLASQYHQKRNALVMEANRCFFANLSEVEAYDKIAGEYGDRLGDHEIRDAVRYLYALYWAGAGRVYRRSKTEKDANVTTCPKCKSAMKKRSYKYGNRLHFCAGCGFMVKDEDIV